MNRFAYDDEHNSYCLTAIGCYERHSTPRNQQYMTDMESKIRNFDTTSREEWAERQLISNAAQLKTKGCEFIAGETLEKFVLRNQDLLD